MEIDIVAPLSEITMVSATTVALKSQWPHAQIVASPINQAGNTATTRVVHLAILVHGKSTAQTSEAIVAIRNASVCPIVVVALDIEEFCEIAWLQLGADVVVGTTSMARLKAVVSALLRRIGAEPGPIVRVRTIGDLTFDYEQATLSIRGIKMKITPTEFLLLDTLSTNAGGCVSSARLMRDVWGLENDAVRKSLKVHVSRLRTRLREGESAASIEGVRGQGYVLDQWAYANDLTSAWQSDDD